MGMSASQARLLSITARLSNNELEQQSLAYSKQRLADSSQQANDTYLNALSKTKYQVLTGYNNSQANYADLTYSQLTGHNAVASGKQYLVKNKDGRVLVSEKISNAFKNNNGDFNKMLRDLGYTQSNIDVSQITASKEAIHDAWDKYLVSVGKSIDNLSDGEHILRFGYTSFSADSFDGYPTYDTAYATDIEGNVIYLQEDSSGYYIERLPIMQMKDNDNNTVIYYQTEEDQVNSTYHELNNVTYDEITGMFSYTNTTVTPPTTITSDVLYIDEHDLSIDTNIKNRLNHQSGDTYTSSGNSAVNYEVTRSTKAMNYDGTTKAQRELYDYAVAITEAFYNKTVSHSSATLQYDAQMVAYYKNIYNEMASCGYTTLSESFREKLITTDAGNIGSEAKVFTDSDWFVRQLKAGNLTLSFYSVSEKGFVSTSIDNDESITEKEDSSAMAIAEQVYKTQMDKIESQDKQFDLQLNKLESEHNALQTEYDAVKKVISENVSKSFNAFS